MGDKLAKVLTEEDAPILIRFSRQYKNASPLYIYPGYLNSYRRLFSNCLKYMDLWLLDSFKDIDDRLKFYER